jgi:hypothetical protein
VVSICISFISEEILPYMTTWMNLEDMLRKGSHKKMLHGSSDEVAKIV